MLLLDLLLARPAAYRHADQSPRAALWMAGFLLTVGALYGVLVARFQLALGGSLQGVPVVEIPGAVLYGGNVIAGVLVALVFHGGVTLVLWLMTRAVGGPGRLGLLYRATAYLLPLAVPALPLLAADSAVRAGGAAAALPLISWYPTLAGCSVAWLLLGLVQVLRTTQGTGLARSLAAVALFTLFCGSILLML